MGYEDGWAALNMSGIYVSLFSGMINIFGSEMLLMAGGVDMAGFGQVVLRYEKWVNQFFEAYADTRILLSGSREEIRAEVERCINRGKNCAGFIMAVGNHIPSKTPVESALYYNEVFEELRYG